MRYVLVAGALSLAGAVRSHAEAIERQGPWVEIVVPQGDPRMAASLSPDLARHATAEIVGGVKLPRSLVARVRETASGKEVAVYRGGEWIASDVEVRWLSQNRILLTGNTNRKNTTFCVLDATRGMPVAQGTGAWVVPSPDGGRLFVLDFVPGGFIPSGAHACAARLVDTVTGTEVILQEWRVGSEDLSVLPWRVSWTPSGAAVTYLCGASRSRTLTVWDVAGEKPKRSSLSLADWPEPVNWTVSSDLKTVAMSYQQKVLVAKLEASDAGSQGVE